LIVLQTNATWLKYEKVMMITTWPNQYGYNDHHIWHIWGIKICFFRVWVLIELKFFHLLPVERWQLWLVNIRDNPIWLTLRNVLHMFILKNK
jgi:hypothetical protein